MCEFENKDATKITSALADSRINFSWTMMSLLVRTLCLCLALMTILLSVSPFSPSFVTMSSSKQIGVCWKIEQMDTKVGWAAQWELLFMKPWHSPGITLMWCLMRRIWSQKNSQRSRKTQALIQVPWKWRNGTKSRRWWSSFSSSSRVSDALTGPVENDEETHAMRKRDMPPPVPERVANPRSREDQAWQDFHSNSDRTHRATSDDAFTHAWFDYSRSVFPHSVKNRYKSWHL